MITFENVTFTYPDSATPALHDVTLTLPDDAFIVVSGPSGAGKSTLLRCINGLVPHFTGGALQGRIRVGDLDPVAAGPETMCRHVGFVFQDPETQFVMDYVEDELAFALENAAVPPAEMHQRIAEVLTYLDLAPFRDRRLTTLSGGEKQRVAIAAVLAFRPRVLVLDEPTSQLDPRSAHDVLTLLARLQDALGLTIVLAEHRLERVLAFADVLVAVRGPGAPLLAGPPQEIVKEMNLRPPVASLGHHLGWSPLPTTVAKARPFASQMVRKNAKAGGDVKAFTDGKVSIAVYETTKDEAMPTATSMPADLAPPRQDSVPAIAIRALTVAYAERVVVDEVTVELFPGEVAVLLGRNGAGKSSLLKAMVGLVPPVGGDISVGGRSIAGRSVAQICREVAYLPQDPSALLFAETVREELRITLRNHGMDAVEDDGALRSVLATLGLAQKAAAYPRDLSVGERQRAALAALLVAQPGTILLDEPTRGLDYQAKAQLSVLILRWRAAGRCVLLVTHDVELAAEVADRAMVMAAGRIVADGDPVQVMRDFPLFTPQIARLFPETDWLTVDDVVVDLERVCT